MRWSTNHAFAALKSALLIKLHSRTATYRMQEKHKISQIYFSGIARSEYWVYRDHQVDLYFEMN